MTFRILVFATVLAGLTACAGSNSTSPEGVARTEGQERGGGDDTGLEFNQALKEGVAELKTMALPEAATVDFASLATKISGVTVLVVSEPLQTKKDDVIQESVAANDPSKMQILVNRSRWHELFGSGLRKALALHEMLSIAGYEETGKYPISTAYMMKLGLTSDPGILDMAATCVQTLVCIMKEPICTAIPRHWDHSDVSAQTVLDVFGKISMTCTDRAGHAETVERVGGFRYGSYRGLASSDDQVCEGFRREVAYATPRCPGF